MLIDEQLNRVEGLPNACFDITLKAPKFNLFTKPSYYTKVALIVPVPTITDNFIPFLESSYILAELIILGPLLNNLKSIKSFSDALNERR